MTKEEVIKLIIKNEGNYSNVSNDSGLETYQGVSRKYHPNRLEIWNKIDMYKHSYIDGKIPWNTKFNDKDLDNSVINFYIEVFYIPMKIDTFTNKNLSIQYLDAGVNMGIGGVQRLLRETFGGNSTNEAIQNANNNSDAYNMFVNARKLYYNRLVEKKPSQQKFLKGWINRVDHITKALGESIVEIEQSPQPNIQLAMNLTSGGIIGGGCICNVKPS